MLFHFLKYLQPTHYFQLLRKDGSSIFPKVEKLPKEILEQLTPNSRFKSEHARHYDLSWQAIQKGYIGNAETYTAFEIVPIVDEYRFLRNYFHPVWVFYVLGLRLLSPKNPFRELAGWWKSRNAVRSDYLKTPIKVPNWKSHKSSFLDDAPLVSVVIPTLNRYDYLKEVLSDFEKQTYKNFEIILIDQSEPFQTDFCKNYKLNLRHIQQKEPALWLARNTAIEKAKGRIIALSEDDVRINPDWLENHLRCLDFFDADISAGVFYPEGSSIPQERSFFCVASQFATGNAMLYKEVFKKVGLFDRQFEKQRMGDAEFGLRLYINGYKLISNPMAYCIDLKASQGGLRIDGGSWDAWRPKKFFAPRPVPSVLYYSRNYFGRQRSILLVLVNIIPSIIPYKFKKNKVLKSVSFLFVPFFLPLILFLVLKSWKLASEKLREGAKIEPYV